jgi:hypothetical protein
MSFPSDDDAVMFERFWAASELTDATQRQYAAGLSEYVSGSSNELDPWSTNAAVRELGPRPLDDLERTFRARRSRREFADQPLSMTQVDRLAHSVAGGAQRTFASAGGLYAVQTLFALVNVADVPCSCVRVVSRESTCGLAPVGALPEWSTLAYQVGSLPDYSPPGLVAVVCIAIEAMVSKYQERAGRFALIEAGHAAQNLTLRATADELACYELGGYADDSLLPALGITRPGLRVASVLMIGTPIA